MSGPACKLTQYFYTANASYFFNGIDDVSQIVIQTETELRTFLKASGELLGEFLEILVLYIRKVKADERNRLDATVPYVLESLCWSRSY